MHVVLRLKWFHLTYTHMRAHAYCISNEKKEQDLNDYGAKTSSWSPLPFQQPHQGSIPAAWCGLGSKRTPGMLGCCGWWSHRYGDSVVGFVNMEGL